MDFIPNIFLDLTINNCLVKIIHFVTFSGSFMCSFSFPYREKRDCCTIIFGVELVNVFLLQVLKAT